MTARDEHDVSVVPAEEDTNDKENSPAASSKNEEVVEEAVQHVDTPTKKKQVPPKTPTPTRRRSYSGSSNKSLSPSSSRAGSPHHSPSSRYSMLVKEDKDQQLVQTPYGPGLVIRTRKNPRTNQVVSRDIELTNWKTTPKKGRPPKPAMLYSPTKFPSVKVEVGNEVTCLFGRGRVLEIRSTTSTTTAAGEQPESAQVVVQLSSWRLAGRSKVTVIVSIDQVQVVRPKKVYEMNVFERVEHAQKLKEEARTIFANKQYERALSKYALAVDAVRYVQHQKDSTNEVRADLLVVMITSCNNAATCASQQKQQNNTLKFDMVMKYAKNALVLIEALEERQTATKTTRVFDILCKDGYDSIKIFGEWKAKSILFLAKAHAEKQNYTQALEECKKAQEAVTKYNNNTTKNKVLLQHEKEIKRIRSACKERKKLELKKEKQRAQAMFGGGGSGSGGSGGSSNTTNTNSGTSSNSSKNSPAAKTKTSSSAGSGSNNYKATKTAPTSASAALDATLPSTIESAKAMLNGNQQKEDSNNMMDDTNQKKNVTFEDGGTPRDAFPDDDDDDDDLQPWYEEHQELLLLMTGLVVAFGFAQIFFGRRSSSRRNLKN